MCSCRELRGEKFVMYMYPLLIFLHVIYRSHCWYFYIYYIHVLTVDIFIYIMYTYPLLIFLYMYVHVPTVDIFTYVMYMHPLLMFLRMLYTCAHHWYFYIYYVHVPTVVLFCFNFQASEFLCPFRIGVLGFLCYILINYTCLNSCT